MCLNAQLNPPDTHRYRSVSLLLPCFTNSPHAGTCFHKNSWHLPRSCSAVLTAIRGPLHLRRSQHYQPPPSLPLWWQRSSSCLPACLPGLQPLPPPPALSLLLFTVPETSSLSTIKTRSLAPACAVCMWNICFCVHRSVTWYLSRSRTQVCEC